ncbi:hypothetical protein [Corynebacterium haemomassiliense]|uniref:hypothetical protein n=1 Tax=Corynebacterium haemomassiliense TaxID=2754726 RepID=UPI0028894B5C|nr:hypothetical protein [Corynebacterium haemomassiliense]
MNTKDDHPTLLAVLIASVVVFVLVGGYGLFTKGGDRPLHQALLSWDDSPVGYAPSSRKDAPWITGGTVFSILEKPGPDPACGELLAKDVAIPVKGADWTVGEPAPRYEVLPGEPSLLAIGIIEADVAEGVGNPISKYFGQLGELCGGQQINPASDLYWSGVKVSDHEFGTVVQTEAGELPAYYSAYAVPGYIILVYGKNISLDQVREVSAAQSKAVEESIWLTPEGQTSPWTFGIVSWLRHFLGDGASETASA